MFIFKIFVERNFCFVEKCFEGANVRQFCNDSRIVENVYKMFVLKSVLKMVVFKSVKSGNCFSL